MTGKKSESPSSNLKPFLIEGYNLGLHPITVDWDTTKKVAIHNEEHGGPYDLNKWLSKAEAGAMGLAYKLLHPWGVFDFDIKNAVNKLIFEEWKKMVYALDDTILDKMCIERSRNGGFHVFFKYKGLTYKVPLAKSKTGAEIISIYVEGLLIYSYPTPGYSQEHQALEDVEELTPGQFDILVSCAAYFDEKIPGSESSTIKPISDYPAEFEYMSLQFDLECSDALFEHLLNSIGLYRVKNPKGFKGKSFIPYLRRGSEAAYSAKVYFKAKRLYIFSASITGFPNWHDWKGDGDTRWHLSPTKILYYKNEGDWAKTMTEMKLLCKEFKIDLKQPSSPVKTDLPDTDPRLNFPYDIFPMAVQNYIRVQTIQPEFLAGSIFIALATAIGNTAVLRAQTGYDVKPVFYMVIVAPPGSSKSPALRKAFRALEESDKESYKLFDGKRRLYKEQVQQMLGTRKKGQLPEKPVLSQILTKDFTIEKLSEILKLNPGGICVLADELSGWLNRMGQYKQAGDELEKWLEMSSAEPILLQRVSKEDIRVDDYTCNVIGGIQTGVLELMARNNNSHNGFIHRFLFIVPKLGVKADWRKKEVPAIITEEFNKLFDEHLGRRNAKSKTVYFLSAAAEAKYAEWFNAKNIKYNKSTTENEKGIIAKYQDYCLRFALVLQILKDGTNRSGEIETGTMVNAIHLTEYFFANMTRALKILAPEGPVDKLSDIQAKFYKALPNVFTIKTAIGIGEKMEIPKGTVEGFISKGTLPGDKKIFDKIKRGEYEKVYTN